jgi:LPXTG-site transpeptidase (sortase) family protein
MKRKEAIKFVIVRSLGNFLLLFALYGVAMTFGPVLSYEIRYRIAEAKGVQFSVTEEPVADTSEPGFADILAGDSEQILIPKDTQFSITIPKIAASAKVYPNVDPANANEYLPVLQKGVAHAKGSVFPGLQGNVYLFAHSTDNWWNAGRYNAVFYLLYHIKTGDEVVVFFEGKRYEYVISQTLIADPTDTSFIAREQKGLEQLVLQTCWPPGTSWKRLYVIATRKG